MQQHLPYLRIIAKPHVAQYIKAHYLNEDAVIRIPPTDLILPLILASCTEDFTKSYKHSAESDHRLALCEILLPNRYRNHYLAADRASMLVKSLEKYFWKQAELFIYRILTDQQQIAYKEDAIKAFYEAHYLSESIYPVDHFRRQLTKMSIKGTRAELPCIEAKPISYKLTRQQCMQVYRLRKHRKLPYRTIARHYHISHEQARNIFQTISNVSVLKPDKNLTSDLT